MSLLQLLHTENVGIAIQWHAPRMTAVSGGYIVFHDTSFVSILISDTDLIISNQAGPDGML